MMDTIRWLLFAHTGSYPQMKASNAHYGTVKQVFNNLHQNNNTKLKQLRSGISKLLKYDPDDECFDDNKENKTNIWKILLLQKGKKI